MNRPPRRLLLHAGIGKTGSSALQAAFVQNREALASAGICYPEHRSDDIARRGGVTSGNGTRLRAWLAPREDGAGPPGRKLRARLVDELDTPGTHTLLYSSEFLYLARPDRLDELRQHLARRGVSLHVVVYVRDVVGHAISSYCQVVKRALFTGSFADYIDPRTQGGYHLPLDRLLRMPGLLGDESVTVLHYDSVQHELVDHFFREVLDVPGTHVVPGSPRVNRSLTAEEVELMRRLNHLLTDKAQARRLSDVLIDLPSLGSHAPTPTSAEVDMLRASFADDVDSINRQFFEANTLAIVGAHEPPPAEDAHGAADPSRREEFLLAALARLAALDASD